MKFLLDNSFIYKSSSLNFCRQIKIASHTNINSFSRRTYTGVESRLVHVLQFACQRAIGCMTARKEKLLKSFILNLL